MTLSEIFSEEGRWLQGCSAKNRGGYPRAPLSDDAWSFCLVGGLARLQGCRTMEADVRALGFSGVSDALIWNDAPGRTRGEVLERVREAGL